MWVYLSIISAVLLGIYDVAKKVAVGRNSVMWVLFTSTMLSAIFLAPFYEWGSARDFLMTIPKTILVSASWITGLIGMKMLPLTTSSTIKASRPVFVVLLSILIFGERLNAGQITGIAISLTALWMLSRSSRREGIYFSHDKGVWWMWASVVTGVASALWDKHLMRGMSPHFVQSWSSLFIALVMGLALIVEIGLKKKGHLEDDGKGYGFKWDWSVVVVAVSILLADMAYFRALKDPESLLSIVSLMRRGCAIVAFVISIFLFKEKNIWRKAIDLGVLMVGMTVMALAS